MNFSSKLKQVRATLFISIIVSMLLAYSGTSAADGTWETGADTATSASDPTSSCTLYVQKWHGTFCYITAYGAERAGFYGCYGIYQGTGCQEAAATACSSTSCTIPNTGSGGQSGGNPPPPPSPPLIASNPKNNGCQRPKCDVGDPINPATGNAWQTETDAQAGGLSFSRTYNSNVFSTDASIMRSIGTRWTQTYDRMALPVFNSSQTMTGVTFVRQDGKTYLFNLVSGAWIGDNDVDDRVTTSYAADGVTFDGWTYVSANGDQTEQYNANGKLLFVKARSGAAQAMTYSDGISNDTSVGRIPANAPVCPNVQAGAVLPAGLLLCVTDNWGHQIQFEYDASRRISKMIDPSNQSTLYAYDGPSGGCTTPAANNPACFANNLTQVTYPDGNSKIYWYNEARYVISGVGQCSGEPDVASSSAVLNLLTGVDDENGVRYASFTYDCMGRAMSSITSVYFRQSTLSYGAPDTSTGTSSTQVTDQVGDPVNPKTNVHNFGFQMVNGVAKFSSVDQPCAECGTITSYTYDANSNITSKTDFNGNVTNYTYDLTRNLEISRTEAAGTAQARTITTQWHPAYHLPTVITEPGRTTTYTYDANGNQLTKTIAAGNTSRTWTYTYNQVGQILTVTGPRRDVTDVTTYSYDANGNLSTVTNALGQVTSLSNYDANGRVGLITDPNGATTALSYSPRGWLTNKLVTAGSTVQNTSYSYDKVGQLIKVTLPDGSYISYTYNPARFLTQVTDSLGNRINYTPDLWGNRIGETVTDPNGVLTRQISRVYDTVNRLQHVNGAAQ